MEIRSHMVLKSDDLLMPQTIAERLRMYDTIERGDTDHMEVLGYDGIQLSIAWRILNNLRVRILFL